MYCQRASRHLPTHAILRPNFDGSIQTSAKAKAIGKLTLLLDSFVQIKLFLGIPIGYFRSRECPHRACKETKKRRNAHTRKYWYIIADFGSVYLHCGVLRPIRVPMPPFSNFWSSLLTIVPKSFPCYSSILISIIFL